MQSTVFINTFSPHTPKESRKIWTVRADITFYQQNTRVQNDIRLNMENKKIFVK